MDMNNSISTMSTMSMSMFTYTATRTTDSFPMYNVHKDKPVTINNRINVKCATKLARKAKGYALVVGGEFFMSAALVDIADLCKYINKVSRDGASYEVVDVGYIYMSLSETYMLGLCIFYNPRDKKAIIQQLQG